MDTSDETRATSVRACPDCGARVQPGQRRCTNCGSSVEQRRRLVRRTPLIAALVVAALGGGAVVVAQAAVTERATADAAAPPEPAAAPVPVAGNPLPAADLPTSVKPKPEPVETPAADDALDLPDLPSIDDADAQDTDAPGDESSKDGDHVSSDTGADDDDLGDAKKLKIKRAKNYDPAARVGAEFGKPKAAIDKRNRTVWDVNVPADGQPFGVGLVLDLGDTKRISSLRIQTPTPGFGAVVYRADATDIPETLDDEQWVEAATVENVSDNVVVPISDEPEWARYVLLWITTPRAPNDTRVAISTVEVLP